MPWTEILGGATGGLAIALLVAFYLGKVALERIADAATRLVDDRLRRAEEVHRTAVAFTSSLDTALRERRIPVYAELWERTGLLPMWPRNTDLSFEDLQGFTRDLRDWYYQRGGMFLSENAREAFFEVQKAVHAVLDKQAAGPVSGEDYGTIRERCSRLRTELTEDLLSRRAPPSVVDATHRTGG